MNEYAPARKTYLDSSQWPLFPGIQRSALVLLKDPVDDDFQVAIVHVRLRRHRHWPPVPAASPEDACSQLPACIGLPGMTPSDVTESRPHHLAFRLVAGCTVVGFQNAQGRCVVDGLGGRCLRLCLRAGWPGIRGC